MADPVVVIGCGSAKRDLAPGKQVPIVDLYTGSLYRARLEYARMYGGPRFVASARHGHAPADLWVETYEADLRRLPIAERAAWSDRVLHTLTVSVPREARIVALVAGPYALPFIATRRRGYDVEIPAHGLPIGSAIRYLRTVASGAAEAPPPAGRGGQTPAPRDYESEAERIREELERAAPADDEDWTISTGALRALLRGAEGAAC